MFLWFFLMLHGIDSDIVCLCSCGSSSCCFGLIVSLFFCVLMDLPHLPWIDCDIVYLCSYGSSSCCIILIVTLFVFVLVVLPHVALNWLWHCLSVFLLFFLVLHLILTLFICVLMALPHVAFDWLWNCLSVFTRFFLMLHWIECGIVYLFSYGSSSCCIVLILTVFICVLMFLPYVALDWLWHCLSVCLWFFLILHNIDSDMVCLFSSGTSSCCMVLIVTLFIYVLIGLLHVALSWYWHFLSMFLWFILMFHWFDSDIVCLCSCGSSSCCIGFIVYLCSYGSCLCCLGLIVTLLSVFLWFFLMLHWINSEIVCLCSCGSSSCCIGLIVTLFICVPMVLPHVALYW